VITWNLFHGRDGLPGLGATRRSTWLRVPEDDGVHLHLNRKLTDLMAQRLATWGPDVCALQEVPTAAIGRIARITGMSAVWTGAKSTPTISQTAMTKSTTPIAIMTQKVRFCARTLLPKSTSTTRTPFSVW